MPSELRLLSNTADYYTAVEQTRARARTTKVVVASFLAVTLGVCGGLAIAHATAPTTNLSSAPTKIMTSRPAVVSGLVATAATTAAMPAVAADTPLGQGLSTLGQAPLGKIGFVVKDAPPLDMPQETLTLYVLIAVGGFLAVFFWIYSGAAASSDVSESQGPSGIFRVEGKIPTSTAGWQIQSQALKARGITKGMSGKELVELNKQGKVTIIDVREASKFERGRIPGSINIPLFRKIEGWTPYKAARRFQFALFGQVGTEYNTNFLSELASKTKSLKGGKIVVLDANSMGTLEATESFPDGKCCHALMSTYLMGKNGFEKADMTFLEGGIDSFVQAGGKVDGDVSATLF